MCSLFANVLFRYDIVDHAQRQIGKVLILYSALVRDLNQYLEKLLESLLNILMVSSLLVINSLFELDSLFFCIYIFSFLIFRDK